MEPTNDPKKQVARVTIEYKEGPPVVIDLGDPNSEVLVMRGNDREGCVLDAVVTPEGAATFIKHLIDSFPDATVILYRAALKERQAFEKPAGNA